MPTATLTSKGQLTVPLAVRQALGLHAGTKVDFIPIADGFKVVPLQKPTTTLKGRFAGRVAKPVSIQEMNDAVADEAVRRNAPPKR